MGLQRNIALHRERNQVIMETDMGVLDLPNQNSKSTDARDGKFVVVCSRAKSDTNG